MHDGFTCVLAFTSDDLLAEYEVYGPPNMPNGDHVMAFRFDLGALWDVTFRKFPDSERYGEIARAKRLRLMR